jgi:hypothetical protein
MRRRLLLLAMALVDQGCVMASRCLLGPTFPPVAPAQTRILAGEPPAGSYDVIATVMVDVAGGAETALTQLRLDASSLGADAIIRTRLTMLNTAGARMGVTGLAVHLHPAAPAGPLPPQITPPLPAAPP